MNYIGRVTKATDRGVYVEIAMGGVVGEYGPMLYLAQTSFSFSDGSTSYAPPELGDSVLVTNVGRIADHFIVLGKVIDPTYVPYDQVQDPYGDGAVTNP